MKHKQQITLHCTSYLGSSEVLTCRVIHIVNTMHSRSDTSLFRRLWAASQTGRQNVSKYEKRPPHPLPSSFVASAHVKGGSER